MLLFLVEYNELPSISLTAAKKLLYVEDALKDKLHKLLPVESVARSSTRWR